MRIVVTAFMLCLLLPVSVQAQEQWSFEGTIEFPEDQREVVFPYLATVADDGTLYVISSRATDTTAHNALWKAAPGSATFELVEDYTAKNDAAVHATRGVTTIGNDVVVSTHSPPQPGGLGFGNFYYYPNGDVTRRRAFNSSNGFGGYGTFTYGVDATDQGFLFSTLSYQTSIRIYDFTDPNADGYGNWVPIPSEQNFANTEVGGHDDCGLAALRDIAVIPGASYTDEQAPFFTSRNASTENRPETCAAFSGGVAIWTGSTATEPGAYESQRISDPAGALALSSFVPTGITADSQGRLWVSGPDSTRLWVKAFEVAGNFAFEALELPSATSESAPDPDGAPFESPNDVALNRTESLAYVTDLFAKKVFVFRDLSASSTEGGAELPGRMRLHHNYPNPFNPSTSIAYEIAAPAQVRLAVYDVMGREVAVLVDGVQAAGAHSVSFDAGALPSGIYLYRLEAFGQRQQQTMLLSK